MVKRIIEPVKPGSQACIPTTGFHAICIITDRIYQQNTHLQTGSNTDHALTKVTYFRQLFSKLNDKMNKPEMHPGINLPKSIAELVKIIETAASIDNSILQAWLSEADIQAGDILPFSYSDHPAQESYGRTRIYQSARVKIFVMTWNPGDFTAIHDHEPAEWGAVQFFGEIEHRLYSADNNHVILKQADTLHSGMRAGVTGRLIHAMGNHTSQPVLTLHIYGTNSNFSTNWLTRVYEPEKERVILTDGSAYLNPTDSDYRVLQERIRFDEAALEDHRQNSLIRELNSSRAE